MCFSLLLRAIIDFNVYIILDFPITYKNASVLFQSECTCLHKTVNMLGFFVKSNENTYPKGRAVTHANVQSCLYKEKREFGKNKLFLLSINMDKLGLADAV